MRHSNIAETIVKDFWRMLSQLCTVYVKVSVSLGSGGTRRKFLTDANQLCVLLLFDMTFSLDEAHCSGHSIKSNANHLNPFYTQILSSQTLCPQYLGSGRLQIRHYLDSTNVSASEKYLFLYFVA